MSDAELLKLVHNSISEIFTLNDAEFFKEYQSLISNLIPSTSEQMQSLQKSLLSYTLYVSELTCVAMAKTLASAGILDISPTDSQTLKD